MRPKTWHSRADAGRWGNALGISVCGAVGCALGVINQGHLQLVGNDAELIAAHVQQSIDIGLDGDAVGGGDELTVGDEADLVGVLDNPLGVGGGEVVPEPEDARAEPGGVGELALRVLGTEFDGMAAGIVELLRPFRTTNEQVPVVGRADGVNRVQMGGRTGVEVDATPLRVSAGDDGSDAHVEIGVCLALTVHAGKAIDEAGDEEFAGAVDDAGTFGNGKCGAGADGGDAAVANVDDGVVNVFGGMAPGTDIDDGAADQHQGGRYQLRAFAGGRQLGTHGEGGERQNRSKATEQAEW